MKGAQDVTVAELQRRIQSLEKELDNANELLSDSKQRGQPLSVLPRPPLFYLRSRRLKFSYARLAVKCLSIVSPSC